ncbi:hypothetical protein DFH27DRAFT_560371, partial [Peziza echinospora]
MCRGDGDASRLCLWLWLMISAAGGRRGAACCRRRSPAWTCRGRGRGGALLLRVLRCRVCVCVCMCGCEGQLNSTRLRLANSKLPPAKWGFGVVPFSVAASCIRLDRDFEWLIID